LINWNYSVKKIHFKLYKKVLITGSTGFVGRHLVPKILNRGHIVLEITRSTSKSLELFGKKTFKIDINDSLLKEKIIEFKPEIVIHLASYLSASDQFVDILKLIDANLLFLSKLLNAVSEIHLDLFINTGSFSEYRNGDEELIPAYFYAATKTASRSIVDYYSNNYGFKQTTIIPYTIYGGNDSQKKIIDLIVDSIHSEASLDLTPGGQVLDFIHINDVTDFYLFLVENASLIDNNQVYKLGTGTGHTLREVAQLVEEITQQKTKINWGAKDYRKSDVMYAVANVDKQKKEFNWTPKTSLIEGLKKMIK